VEQSEVDVESDDYWSVLLAWRSGWRCMVDF
jgi:hypothetical protein